MHGRRALAADEVEPVAPGGEAAREARFAGHADGAHLPARGELAYRLEDVRVPNHNVLVRDGRVLYNDSNGGRLVELDLSARREVRSVAVPGEPSFARGLAAWRDGLHLVGSQRPAAVHVVDLDAERLVDSVALSDEPRESVYAIALVPDEFDDPPAAVAFPD